VHILEAA